jgi:integrase/recombinase XerD
VGELILQPAGDRRPDPVGTLRAADPWTYLRAAWLASHTSPNTRDAYRRDLDRWETWCDTVAVHPLAARRAHVDLWRAHQLETQHLAPTTVSRRLAAISALYRYAVQDGLTDINPVADAARPHIDKIPKTPGLNRDQMIDLLDAADNDGPRSRALIYLLAYNGLRISSALGTDIEHLGHDAGWRTLRITLKGGRQPAVALNPLVCAALDVYLDGRSSGPIFLSDRGGRLTRQTAWDLVKRLAETAGLDPAVTLHSLRVGFITLSLDDGAPIRDVSHAAGHASIAQTEWYDRGRGQHARHPTHRLAGYLTR